MSFQTRLYELDENGRMFPLTVPLTGQWRAADRGGKDELSTAVRAGARVQGLKPLA